MTKQIMPDVYPLQGQDYMQAQATYYIVYSMCFLSIVWAIHQTVKINKMPMDPEKVKISKHIAKSEKIDNELNELVNDNIE